MRSCVPAGGTWHSWCALERPLDSYSTLRFRASWSRWRQGEFAAPSPSDYVSEHFLYGMWREFEGELNSIDIFLARGRTFEALEWSQNKLHDLGMNTMCWQRHQLTALKANFRAAFLVPTAVSWPSQIFWKACKGLGGMPPWACTVVGTSAGARTNWGHSPLRGRCESELSGRQNPAVFSASRWVPLRNLESHCRGNGRVRKSLGHNMGEELQQTQRPSLGWYSIARQIMESLTDI